MRDSTYALLRAQATAMAATYWNRPEDASWHPKNPKQAFFTTTTYCRLYRITFDDITAPELGGVVEMLVDGGRMGMVAFDNVAVDRYGHVMIASDE